MNTKKLMNVFLNELGVKQSDSKDVTDRQAIARIATEHMENRKKMKAEDSGTDAFTKLFLSL